MTDRTTETGDPRVRVRGVYATALTALLSGTREPDAPARSTDPADGTPAKTTPGAGTENPERSTGDEYSRHEDTDGVVVTRPSVPIRERFDRAFPTKPATVAVEASDDRTGVSVTGDPEDVPTVTATLSDVAVDTLVVADPTPQRATYEATVDRTVGGGAILDLGERAGYLPFDRADGYVDTGDRLRVQVDDPAAPWSDRRPVLDTRLRAGGPLVDLVRGAGGVTAAVPDDRVAELVRTTEVLSATAPTDWGIEWQYPALEADLDAMDAALSAAAEEAARIEAALDEVTVETSVGDASRVLAVPRKSRWVWFGREARFALDRWRRSVTATMAGHHRVKAGGDGASDAVDFLEAVCGSVGADDDATASGQTEPASPTVRGGNGDRDGSETTGVDGDTDETGADPDFPFDAVTRQFGPREGDDVRIAHGKPDGRLLDLGRATVTERGADGRVVVRREMSSAGEYDGLGTQRRPGDVAVTRIREGRWWYPTAYRGSDGERKGTYVNVCTPVELFPDAVRYVDLHVDVVRLPDGTVRRVDEDELAASVDRGELSERLAKRARAVAATVERALS